MQSGIETLSEKHVIWLDDFTYGDLDLILWEKDTDGKTVGGYLSGQVEGHIEILQASLKQTFPILQERLMIPLCQRLTELGVQQATLIPGGRLGLLPLPAAVIDSPITFAYAPSARALRSASHVVQEREEMSNVLLGVGNPLPNPKPLNFARTEVENIASLFTEDYRRVLYEEQASRTTTLANVSGASHLHFSCHGAFNSEKPLESSLSLSGNDTLTMRDLLDGGLDLSASRLTVLSACQTGITDFQNVPDEAIGFPAAFLQAGAPGIVSTLWSVSDVSTALLMIRFYHHHLKDGLDPAIALQKSQLWLRDSTAKEMGLSKYYKQQYLESGKKDSNAFVAMRYYQANSDIKPFSHPYYWAAFTFSGV